MKNLFFIFLLIAGIANAGGLGGTAFNYELFYLYGTFIAVIILVVGTDQFLKYVFRKFKEHQDKLHEQTAPDSTGE